MKKIVWITGANGFTGFFMAQYLKSVDPAVRIVGIDISPSSEASLDEYLIVDLCDKQALIRALTQEPPDIVIHLAGLMPPQSNAMMQRVNVDASVTLAEAIAGGNSGKARVICAGSAAEYGSGTQVVSEDIKCQPENDYGRSKHQQVTRMLSFNSPRLEVLVARPFNLIGPGLSENLVAGRLCQQFVALDSDNQTIVPKGPIESVRDFIDVRDVVSAYWTLATSGEPGQIYNICSGTGTSISKLIDIMQAAFRVDANVRPEYDRSVLFADSSIGENTKLKLLGWHPEYSIEESVAAMAVAATAA